MFPLFMTFQIGNGQLNRDIFSSCSYSWHVYCDTRELIESQLFWGLKRWKQNFNMNPLSVMYF